MTRSTAKKPGLRRLAMVTAAFSALVMSSGIALMVSATPANAAVNKVGICHATSSDSNPYIFISVDDDSVKLNGHLAHKTNPNKRWKSTGSFTFHGVTTNHVDGTPKPDFIGTYTKNGQVIVGDGIITKADCEGDVADTLVSAEVDYTDATCDVQTPSYDGTGSDGVTFTSDPAVPVAGQSIVVTAHAPANSVFSNNSDTLVFPEHEFAAFDPEDCIVAPPETPTDAVANVVFTNPSCDNANDIGYTTSNTHAATFDIIAGSVAPGKSVTIKATADAGHAFPGGALTKVFPAHVFPAEADLNAEPCVSDIVETPAVTPTVVESGLTPDLRGEQGLALLVAGMVMMVIAGGLGLRSTGKTRS